MPSLPWTNHALFLPASQCHVGGDLVFWLLQWWVTTPQARLVVVTIKCLPAFLLTLLGGVGEEILSPYSFERERERRILLKTGSEAVLSFSCCCWHFAFRCLHNPCLVCFMPFLGGDGADFCLPEKW